MLSRGAQSIYWMGRYLERALHLCHLLRLQAEALVDRPVREIYFGWSRIYANVDLQPPGGSLELNDDEDYALVDSYTLADDLTFERANPASVRRCFAHGRENARQMRHGISAEMWTSLNAAYLRIEKLNIRDLWAASPESFYAETAAEINNFWGVAEATMYRQEGWHFMQLGRFVERAQLSAVLLLAQLDSEAEAGEESDQDWTSLLRAYHALEVYSRRYGVEVRQAQALDLLVTDPQLPDSVCRSLDSAAAALAALGPGSDADSCAAARGLADRLSALVHDDWPDRDDRRGLLDQVCEDSIRLHDLVTAAYFDHNPDDSPAP